jgi:hypothetical protein
MNEATHTNRFLVLGGVVSLLALLGAACGSDPNGTPSPGSGTGGKAGGGAGGAGALPTLGAIVGMPIQTFDTSSGNFILSNYAPTNGEVNLAVASPGTTTVSWDGTEGSPTAGSLKVMAPFSDWNQWVEVQASTLMPYMDFTGKKLHVRLKVASGFGSDMYALGGAQALVNTTSSYVQVNAATNVALGTGWQEFTVDVSTATLPGFDAKMVITYGLHIYSGAGNSTAAKPTAAVFYVDSFSIE